MLGEALPCDLNTNYRFARGAMQIGFGGTALELQPDRGGRS
jgi:hypothetical protein